MSHTVKENLVKKKNLIEQRLASKEVSLPLKGLVRI